MDHFVGENGVFLPLPPELSWVTERLAPFVSEAIAGIENHRLDRGDWRNWSSYHLALRLSQEVGELLGSLAEDDGQGVLKEAPHVAALALMVWDVQREAKARS